MSPDRKPGTEWEPKASSRAVRVVTRAILLALTFGLASTINQSDLLSLDTQPAGRKQLGPNGVTMDTGRIQIDLSCDENGNPQSSRLQELLSNELDHVGLYCDPNNHKTRYLTP